MYTSINVTNEIKVQLPEIADKVEIKVNPFGLFSSDISVSFTVLKGENPLYNGELILPAAVIKAWKADDSVVKNYVLDKLGLTEATV